MPRRGEAPSLAMRGVPRRQATVLIIEDEVQIRRVVRRSLEPELRVLEAETARAGIDLAAAQRPEIIILDLGLPDGHGIDVCREIRLWSQAPILVLSVRHSERDKVDLLEAGADDFVTKPFSTLELTARLRALLRRAQEGPAAQSQLAPIPIGDLVLNLDARTLRRQGRPVHLTPLEWGLLRTLVMHAGRTLTHTQLLAAVWEEDREPRRQQSQQGHQSHQGQQNLRVHLANLRRKIEDDVLRPRLIVTEPGVGYRFEMPA